ncbi:fluoride efflux transporter FluC [Bacillus sp. EB01]|uniref:fluoride efflux transporter FluC n=1 Tax=Bacillus sp. EB01 TaxID=1347086 RepID=UPI0005C7702B|nr:CrcB family protein [Bacillus sp. EB01]
MTVAFIAAGGFLGAVTRYSFSRWLNSNHSSRIPYGTLVANLIGAFLLGFLIVKAANGSVYAFVGIGFTGALTTFSTLMLELNKLQLNLKAILYALISFGAGLLLLTAGMFLGK